MEVCLDSPNKFQKQNGSQKTKWPPNTKLSITHSFSSIYGQSEQNKKYKSTKVLITQTFFELQTTDFAWKFIWTVQSNGKVQKYKNTKVQNRKVQKFKKRKKCKNTKI